MIWLVGNKGMLGTEVERALTRAGFEVEGSDREVDITRAEAVEAYAAGIESRGRRFEWIVNCAAYTAVDKAEDEVELCFRLNRDGAENLARAASARGAALVQISTDYVFDGARRTPYREEDARNPAGVYAKSKAEGEEAIERTMERFYILRTAWLFGKAGGNFVRTMLKLFGERDEINVVSDQTGSPTYAVDLAEAILSLVTAEQPAWGIYHYTNTGQTSWYEFAMEIQRQALSYGLLSKRCRINPVSTGQYPTRAKRPGYSVLGSEKIKRTFGLRIRPWQEALSAFMEELARG